MAERRYCKLTESSCITLNGSSLSFLSRQKSIFFGSPLMPNCATNPNNNGQTKKKIVNQIGVISISYFKIIMMVIMVTRLRNLKEYDRDECITHFLAFTSPGKTRKKRQSSKKFASTSSLKRAAPRGAHSGCTYRGGRNTVHMQKIKKNGEHMQSVASATETQTKRHRRWQQLR